jgi:ABC-2 type transport system ATP-binding protein
MAKNIIQVKNLVKRYAENIAVHDVSFNVVEGEIFGLLGPNGAGKTTTLEIIETLKTPSEGDITVDGISIHDDPEEIKKRIGIQLQSAGFYPNLNLVELLNMFADMYGVETDAMAMLREFQLEEKAKAYFDQMSGGQKQRFSLATTLINNPRIIFLDEPTTGLDPQARINLWDVIHEINEKGVTIVMTTHYMDEAEKLCDRLAIMDHGHIIAEGSPEKLINNLLESGFERHTEVRAATLEDVFLNLTGRTIREE